MAIKIHNIKCSNYCNLYDNIIIHNSKNILYFIFILDNLRQSVMQNYEYDYGVPPQNTVFPNPPPPPLPHALLIKLPICIVVPFRSNFKITILESEFYPGKLYSKLILQNISIYRKLALQTENFVIFWSLLLLKRLPYWMQYFIDN